jgi:hypothetical protein
MIGRRYMLVALIGLAVGLTIAGPVSAAGLFTRKPKPSSQRATELIGLLRNDPAESKRAAAAEELGNYDLKTYPEIVPPLLQALNDPAAEVRSQAVQTLGKLRPVSQEIGMALEQAEASDSSMKVRMHARTSLWSYHLSGYRSPKNPPEQKGPTLPNQPANPIPGPPSSTTQEPPLADRPPVPPAPPPVRLVPAPVMKPAQPPVLQPPSPAVARPMPSSPPPPTLVPTPSPVLVPPPPEDLGPSLSAPK